MRQQTVLLALAVALALVVVPATGAAVLADEGTETVNETNETAPGERLSGVVGVGEAEFDGDIDKRSFGINIAQAETEDAQADVVAAQLGTIEERLAAFEDRKEALDQQRADGEISNGKYNAEIAKLAAQTQTASELINQSERTAGELPTDLLDERGVDADRIQSLKDRTNELSGPEVAEIARNIAGPTVGETPAADRPIDIPDRPDRSDDNETATNQTSNQQSLTGSTA